jgi:hypothetical protein
LELGSDGGWLACVGLGASVAGDEDMVERKVVALMRGRNVETRRDVGRMKTRRKGPRVMQR